MIWSDDPVRDAAAYDAEAEEKIKQLPVCDECNEHIQAEGYYDINGKKICPDCMSYHWEWIEV